MQFTIISGGQTGADRAALDWALHHGVKHGGWCPRGRLAEDGPLPPRYLLQETPTSDYAQRTEWNVRDSDGTVIFSRSRVLRGGSRFTLDLAHLHRKPCLQLCGRVPQRAAHKLVEFIQQHAIHVLNVAGPRASQEAEIGAFVMAVLDHAWPELAGA